MKRTKWTLIGGAAVALLAGIACGDGPDDDATPTLDTSIGPTPVLGDMITGIVPPHGFSIPKAQSTAGEGTVGGTCVVVDFTKFPEAADRDRLLWVRLLVDGVDVSKQTEWRLENDTDPLDGTVCYKPAAGLSLGQHDAIAVILNPSGGQNPVQTVTWSFRVTE